MKKLIEVQALIEHIEKTANFRYRSTFDYLDDKNLIVESYSWQEISIYKTLLDRMEDLSAFVKSNNRLEIIDYSNE